MNDILPEQTPLWRYFEGTVAGLLDNYGYSRSVCRSSSSPSCSSARSVK
jgi:hypothetical protein